MLTQHYAVAGVERYRDDDDIRTKNCNESCHQNYPTWQAAIDAYTRSYNNNQVIAYPEPNTRWWTMPVRVRNSSELAADTSTSSEEALWASFDEDPISMAALDGLRHLALNW